MNILEKKFVAVLFMFVFLISGIISSSAYTIKKDNENEIYIKSLQSNQITKKVTVYRYGINGDIKPIEIEIKLEKGQDINNAISKKCEDLLKDDIEFQSLTEKKLSIGILSLVNTYGRGLHIKPLPRFKFILCRYPRDQKAYTTIRYLIGGNPINITGPHVIISFGFFGFKWWLDRLSILGFFLRTGYIGFSLFTIVRKF